VLFSIRKQLESKYFTTCFSAVFQRSKSSNTAKRIWR